MPLLDLLGHIWEADLSLLQKEHPTDRLWEQVFCCAEASDKLTEYDLLICSRATCGPVASKIKLSLVTHRAPGRVTGSLLQDCGQLCGAGLGLKYMGFRVFRLCKKMKSFVPTLDLLVV